MKIVSWNVRGLGGVKKRRKVLECMSKFRPDMIVLQETKKEVMNDRLVRSSVGGGYSEWSALPAIGSSGGILMAWKPNIIKKIDIRMGAFSISMQLVEISEGVEWLFIGVYGPPTVKNRGAFWEELRDIRKAWNGPWVVSGDFNVIRLVNEKHPVGVRTRSMKDFNEFIQNHSLRDSSLSNANYT